MKKFLSIVLCLSVLLSTFLLNAQAENKSVADYELFSSLGVIGSEYEKEKPLTRGEFADLAVRASGLDFAHYDVQLPYYDVSEKTPFYESIKAAYSMGLIGKNENFYPDEKITCMEAASMIVKLIGYTEIAEREGGWPDGYMKVFYSNKISEGVSFEKNSPVTLDQALKFIENAYNVKVVDKDYKGAYKVTDESFMEIFLHINEGKGIVTATSMADIENDDTYSDRIKIDGKTYSYNGESRNLIGKSISFYYRDENTDFPLVLSVKEEPFNKVTSVLTRDISEKTTATAFIYNDVNKKEKTLHFDENVSVIVNGKTKFAYTKDDLIPEEGNVVLIDNTGDNKIDVVCVNNYRVVVVSRANEKEKNIALKYGEERIELEDKKRVEIYKNDKPVKISELKEWDVLSVISCDENVFIYVSDETASGKVTALTSDNGSDIIEIDGKEYIKSKTYIEKSSDIKLGSKGVFYLNLSGEIVCFDMSTTSKNDYMIMYKAFYNKKKRMAEFRLFTKDNEFINLGSGEKIKINDVRYEDEEAVNYINTNYLHKPVLLEADKEGLINKIILPEDKSSTPGYRGYDEDKFTLDKSVTEKTRFFYSWAAGCYCKGDTPMYLIPANKPEDEDSYIATDFKSEIGTNSTEIHLENVKFYDLNRFNQPSLITVEVQIPDQEKVEVDLYDEYFVISKIQYALNEYDEMKLKICGYFEGQYKETWVDGTGTEVHNVKEAMMPDGGRLGNTDGQSKTKWGFIDYTVDDLQVGDVIQPSFNAHNELTGFRLMWSSKLRGTDIRFSQDGTFGGNDLIYTVPGQHFEISESTITLNGPNPAMLYTSYGKVLDIEGKDFRYETILSLRNREGNEVIKNRVERVQNIQGKIYVLENETVREGNANDIAIGDNIYLQTRDFLCRCILVVK